MTNKPTTEVQVVTSNKESDLLTPFNPVTGKKYFGKLAEQLRELAEDFGYPSHEWATLDRWNSIGEVVSKGQKGYKLVRTVKGHDPADPNAEPSAVFFLFNRCQLQSFKAS